MMALVMLGSFQLGAQDLKKAQWIGSTVDRRPVEWAVRGVTFNRPPHDISSWKPTEKELRSTPRKSYVSPLLRKEFSVEKEIESAKIFVCGLGLYELRLNGNKVGDHVLAPAQTSYDERAFYNVFDVTEQIRRGDNAIGLMLGNGFYGQNAAFGPNLSYGEPRAKAVLLIRYADGSETSAVSDGSWRAGGGPVLVDNVYLGESFDARLMPPDWSAVGFVDSEWSPVEIMKEPGGRLVQQRMEPLRKVCQVKPVAILPAEDGWIVDMGENMTGWLEIAVSEKEGTVVRMRFAEHLMPDRKNIDTALEWAKATHCAPQGLIASAWKREDDSIAWQVGIPAGSKAQVELPQSEKQQLSVNAKPAGANSFELESGESTIEVRLPQSPASAVLRK